MILIPGLIFYWLSWVLWTIITFFHKKNVIRTQVTIVILCLLIFSNETFKLMEYQFSISFIMMFIISFFLITKLTSLPYKLFISAIITLTYMLVLTIEMWEPVWIIIPRITLISFLSVSYSIFLIKRFKDRLVITMYGMCIGEAFHSHFILQHYNSKVIGDLLFFDQILLTVSLLYIVYVIQKGIKALIMRLKTRRITLNKNFKIPS